MSRSLQPSFGPKNGFRDLDTTSICDLGCLWWTTLLSLEYVLAECTAPAMACFLDTRSESNCKEHLTDRYRARTRCRPTTSSGLAYP